MADIKCTWTRCKNNDAEAFDENFGYCTKQFIILESTANEGDAMECKQYETDKEKPSLKQLAKRQATPKQMSDALEGAK